MVVVPIAVMGVIGMYLAITTLKSYTIQQLELSLSSKAETFEKFLGGVRGDLMYLKESGHLKSFMNTNRSWYLKALAEDLLSFSKNRPQYYQLRYIDENGFERVRIDSDGVTSKVIAKENLQLKRDRYYFTLASIYPPGTVYVSPMDYNVEWGKVEQPQKKVVRFATSVADNSGIKRGIIVLNLYADYLLNMVQELEKVGGTALLVDSWGRYIFRQTDSSANDLMAETGGGLYGKLEPSLIPKLMSRRQGTITSGKHIISYVPIFTGDVGKKFTGDVGNNFWVLGIRYPVHIIFDSVTKLSFYLLTIGVIAFTISISLGLYMSRRLASPILQLNEGVDHIGKRDFKHRVHIKTGDEIEDLADKFNLMASRLEDFDSKITSWNEDLQNEVEKRTKELKNSEAELVRERDKLKNFIHSAGEGVIITDMDRKINLINPAALKILALSSVKLKNKSLFKSDLIEAHIFEELINKGRVHYSTTKEYNGKTLDLSVTILRSKDGDVQGSMILFRDMTEYQKMIETRREMERQIFQAEKLVSLGVLSAGIAHEIGNPLAAIKVSAQALAEEEDITNTTSFYIARLVKEVDRLNKFVKTFGDFAYSHTKKITKCQMENVLEETVFWMRKEAENHGVVINFNSSKATLKEVSVDPDRIKQVLINLIINAVHSMPDGGKVGISIKGVRIPKRGVEISVSDEGAGIPEEDMSRVFDPFYTTKSNGTGLGLAVSMKIVKDHGGDLSIDSTVNCGTTCKVFLPYSTKGKSHAA